MVFSNKSAEPDISGRALENIVKIAHNQPAYKTTANGWCSGGIELEINCTLKKRDAKYSIPLEKGGYGTREVDVYTLPCGNNILVCDRRGNARNFGTFWIIDEDGCVEV